MVTITHYAVDPRASSQNVRVEYIYTVFDPIANEDIVRGGAARFTDGQDGLADPQWGDLELRATVAAHLGVPLEQVTFAAPQ